MYRVLRIRNSRDNASVTSVLAVNNKADTEHLPSHSNTKERRACPNERVRIRIIQSLHCPAVKCVCYKFVSRAALTKRIQYRMNGLGCKLASGWSHA